MSWFAQRWVQQKKATTGPDWFDLPAPAAADLPKLHREVEALRLRNSLDPKRFYRKEEGDGKGIKGLPKHFAASFPISSVFESAVYTRCRSVLSYHHRRHLEPLVPTISLNPRESELLSMNLWTMRKRGDTPKRSFWIFRVCVAKEAGAPGPRNEPLDVESGRTLSRCPVTFKWAGDYRFPTPTWTGQHLSRLSRPCYCTASATCDPKLTPLIAGHDLRPIEAVGTSYIYNFQKRGRILDYLSQPVT